MADEGGVGVGLHAFVPGHTGRGRGQVRSVVSPTPRVGRGPEGDGDVVAQQVDDMGLRGMRGRYERGDVLVRVGHPIGALVQAGAVGVDRRGRVVQNLARCRCPSSVAALGEHRTTRIQCSAAICLNGRVSLAITIQTRHGRHRLRTHHGGIR